MDATGTKAGTGTKAVKLVGEALVPGVSLLLDGDVKGGTIHFAGGFLGKVALGSLGPAAWVYAAADSWSKSTTGKHFHQHFIRVETA
jgi:hypothetical protein